MSRKNKGDGHHEDDDEPELVCTPVGAGPGGILALGQSKPTGNLTEEAGSGVKK